MTEVTLADDVSDVAALPGTVLGAWVGAAASRRLSDRHFHWLVLILLGVSGLPLIPPAIFEMT